jgi:DnaK suppressor protein
LHVASKALTRWHLKQLPFQPSRTRSLVAGIVLERGGIAMMPVTFDSRRRLEERRVAIERAAAEAPTATVARELAETQAALERVEQGNYGRCEVCGGAIGRQRLLALPAARYCINCTSAG